jgi:hypothetical protein
LHESNSEYLTVAFDRLSEQKARAYIENFNREHGELANPLDIPDLPGDVDWRYLSRSFLAVSLRSSRDYGDTFPGLVPYLLWADALDRDAVAGVYWLDYELITRYLDTWSRCSLTRSVTRKDADPFEDQGANCAVVGLALLALTSVKLFCPRRMQHGVLGKFMEGLADLGLESRR